MARRIQIKRGLYADMPVLAVGELAYCTDIKKLFVGTAEGINVEVTERQAEVTWQELKDLRDSSALVPGREYRITDYVTTTVQENTQSAGHPFDIIVTADDVDKLNENARAVHSDRGVPILKGITASIATEEGEAGDVLKRAFSFDNYGWTPEDFIYAWGTDEDISDGDPVNFIYTRSTNPAEGDDVWRDGDYGIVVSRVEEGYFANSKLEAWKLKYCLDNDTNRFAWADEVNGKGVIYRMVDEFNNDCPYDFKNIQFKRMLENGMYDEDSGVDTWVYTFTISDLTNGEVVDISLKQNTEYRDDEGQYRECANNVIKEATLEYQPDGLIRIQLNDNVFLNIFEGDYSDYYGCQGNTFGNSCQHNTFGDSCWHNTFGDSCWHNTFGNNCSSNTFGNDCWYLQISDASWTAKKYISVDNAFNGASSANRFDLYDPAILNKGHQVTFKKSASGKYLMLWATDTGTMTGKVKATNTTPTWEDIV